MSKSYRKPYATFTSAGCSAADDKRTARRCWRRAQEHAIRTHRGDWEELLIPARYEASFNDVWGWKRDGKQRLQKLDHNDFNPYWATRYCSQTDEELIERCHKRIERQRQWIADLSRK